MDKLLKKRLEQSEQSIHIYRNNLLIFGNYKYNV